MTSSIDEAAAGNPNMKLQSILGDQFSTINSDVAVKLNNYIESQDQNIDKLKSELSQLKASQERRNFQLETELASTQSQLVDTKDSYEKLKFAIAELEEKYSASQKKNEALQETHQKTILELQNLQCSINQLSNEKTQLSDILTRKGVDNQNLNEQISILQSKLDDAISAKQESLVKTEEIEIRNINIEHSNRKLEKEKELFQQQIVTLNEELTEKAQEILKLRKEKSTKVLELQSELEQKVEEARIAKEFSNNFKKQLSDKEMKIENLIFKNKEAHDNSLLMEEQFNQEIQALTKLKDLHKKNCEENQEKIKELVKTIEEMHKLLKQTGDENNQLEKSINEAQDDWNTKLEEKDAEIAKLGNELQNINEVLSKTKVEGMFPSAAATSNVLKSGMSLTQIYSELVKSQTELQTERFEKQRLHEQLKQILDEIEEKTPLFNRKLQEYQNALETITCLRNQLAESISDQERLQEERDESIRKVQFYQRETERTKNLVSDLSRQVRNLLKEIEEAKGGPIIDDIDMSNAGGDSDAGDIITKHLVTFNDINELQEKNQQLLAVVRDLSDQIEENEKMCNEAQLAELKQKLADTTKQLEELQEERKHQITLVESVVRQKDIYKSMVSQHNISMPLESFSTSTPLHGSKKSLDNSQISLEVKEELKHLQDEFDNYRKEKQQDYLMVTEQLDKFRDELSESRIQNAKLNSELEYIKEKCELAQSKAENYKKEVTIFREKSQKYSTSAIQHQQTISVLRQDLISMQEKLTKAELTVQNLQAERELLKNTEIRLLQEKETLYREQQSNARVMSNLKALENNIERMQSEAKINMQKQLEKLEQELELTKGKLDSEVERYQSTVKAWEVKSEDLQAKLLAEVGKNNKTHEDLVEAYSQLHEAKLEISTLQAKLSAAQTQLSRKSPGDGRAISNEVRLLQSQLNDAKNEINDWKQKLEIIQKSYENSQSIANGLEKHMKEEMEASRQCKESLEKSLKEKEEEISKLESMLKELEQQNNSLKDEITKLTCDRDQLIKNMDTLKHELDKSLSLVKQAQKIEQDAQSDKQEQARLVAEAQEHYQRELMLHSSAVQELTTLREQVQGIRHDLLAAESERDSIKQSMLANKEAFEERESLMKKEMEIMAQKCEDLQMQNEALFQEVEVLSSQLSTLKNSDWMKSDSSLTSSSTEPTTEHLMEVVRYLKKEKQIATSQHETSLAECNRFKLKNEILERKISEVEMELKTERERANLIAASESQHQELLKKVEMLNLLSESNRILRDEKDAAIQKNGLLEARVVQLETQLAPLQKNYQDSLSQMDVVNAECLALRNEIKKWQARVSQLLEQSRKHDPEDLKKSQEENNSLKSQLAALNEEKMRFKAELSKQSATISEMQKDLSNLQSSCEKDKQSVTRLEQELSTSKSESAEHQRTTLQVKKIARKYKTEYTELKTQYDDMATKLNTSGEASAAQAAKEQQVRQEMQIEFENKTKEANEKAIKATEEVEKLKEEVTRLLKNEENNKAQEERLRRLVLQLKKRMVLVNTERDNLTKEKTDKIKEIEELNNKVMTLEQSSEEESLRSSTFKSQYEAKLIKMEKEMKALKENKERLEKQVEELSRQKQSARPSTSAGLVERASSTISEPPLIRPLTPPMISSGGPGSLRHPSHSHQTASSARSTPTASIRPMAIGTSTASATVVASHASSSRTATVTPTTATTITTSEADNMPVTTAHVLPTVPQATVQPTPAVVANITTVSIAPSTSSANEQLSVEVASSVAESSEPVFVSAIGAVPTSRFRQSELPGSQDDSRAGQSEADDSCSSSVVSVSVVSTSPQTQVVTPTVKRPREDIEPQSSVITRDTDSPDTTGSAAPQVKRIRIVGDTPVTVERASVVTSGTSLNIPLEQVVVNPPSSHQIESTSSGITRDDHPSKPQDEVMPERPGVIVTPEPQTTPVTSDSGNNNNLQSTSEPETSTKEEPSRTQPVSPENLYSSSQQSTDVVDAEESKLDEADESKKSFTEQEFDDDDNIEEGEVMDEGESYEEGEEQMPDAQEDEDDEMGDFQYENDEEIAEHNSDEGEITIEDDSQMDILGGSSPLHHSIPSNDNVPTSTSNQHDIQSAMVTGNTSSSGSSTIMTTSIGSSSLPTSENQDVLVPGTSQSHHRPAILPRVPPRTERIPSVGHQHLTPFSISGQGGTFEDGDDSIVPSTPTLFVQGRGDGFSEAVISPQVPHGRFVFTNTSDPGNQPCQLVTQGALGVDDTRMDLSQFDEGSGRSVPTTPLQVSPPADTPDVPDSLPSSQTSMKSQVSTTGLTDPQVSSTLNIPTIMVTPNEDISLTCVLDESSEGREAVTIDEANVTIEEPKEEEVLTIGASSESVATISELGAADEGVGVDKESSTTSSTIVEPEEGNSDTNTDAVANKAQSQRKPITWDGTRGSTAASNTAPVSTMAPTSSGPGPALLPFPHPPPRASRPMENVQRGRRLRIRGAGGTYSPRGSGQHGNWPMYWRGRGRGPMQ